MKEPFLKIVDYLNPEDNAMLQALYSRSADSVEEHLKRVEEVGSGKFMEQYYVGYNHKSIADCGSTTIFTEGVSLLAAKEIQNWPLYSGQETSTRYIDMSKQPIIDPVGSHASLAILAEWMAFYVKHQDRVAEIIRLRYPKRESEKQETYDRAVKARVFDVLRGFLPAGITTQLSWHTNLRQAGDHLSWMIYHPAPEIVRIAKAMRELLAAQYPASGFDRSGSAGVSGIDNKNEALRNARQEWMWRVATEWTYSARWVPSHAEAVDVLSTNGRDLGVDVDDLGPYAEMVATRPDGCVLPHILTSLGQFNLRHLLDFGSFRDAQRHRNGVVNMPLLDTSFGFEPWYLQQLGDPRNGDVGGLRDEAVELIYKQQERILALPANPVERQYYVALGFRVPCQMTMALPALLYYLELRSKKTVHPTLRRKVHDVIRKFQHVYPHELVALHVDTDPDDWDVRRGNQTITKR